MLTLLLLVIQRAEKTTRRKASENVINYKYANVRGSVVRVNAVRWREPPHSMVRQSVSAARVLRSGHPAAAPRPRSQSYGVSRSFFSLLLFFLFKSFRFNIHRRREMKRSSPGLWDKLHCSLFLSRKKGKTDQ